MEFKRVKEDFVKTQSLKDNNKIARSLEHRMKKAFA